MGEVLGNPGRVDPAQALAARLDQASLTLLVDKEDGALYHLPQELIDLATNHALWVFIGGYATNAGKRFLVGLHRRLGLPTAEDLGESVGKFIAQRIRRGKELLESPLVPGTRLSAEEIAMLRVAIDGLGQGRVDEKARARAKQEFHDSLRSTGATRSQAERIVTEIDATVFRDSPATADVSDE